MAIYKSMIGYKGTLSGMCFYKSNGKDIVRVMNPVSKERMMHDKEFKSVRANMYEFGAASRIGKVLRTGIDDALKQMGDATFTGRLVKILRNINLEGEGDVGRRNFSFSEHKSMMKDFEFKPSTRLIRLLTSAMTVEANAERNWFLLKLSTISMGDLVKGPASASHLEVICSLAILPDFSFNPEENQYEPMVPGYMEMSKTASSGFVKIEAGLETLQIPLELNFYQSLPEKISVVCCVGVKFYEFNAGKYLPFKTAAAKIVEVF